MVVLGLKYLTYKFFVASYFALQPLHGQKRRARASWICEFLEKSRNTIYGQVMHSETCIYDQGFYVLLSENMYVILSIFVVQYSMLR